MTPEYEYRNVDKTDWPEGAWKYEPDKVQWTDEATGLPCLIVRNPGGALCGYAGVSKEHPFHGREDPPVEAHGGITFSHGCSHGKDAAKGICHIPAPDKPDDVWWFGFDCSHCCDVSPLYDRVGMFKDYFATYKSLNYVISQVESLARQLDGLHTGSQI